LYLYTWLSRSIVPLIVLSIACSSAVRAVAQRPGTGARTRSIGIRLGANLTPNTGAALGLDYTFPASAGRGMTSRLTLEGIFGARKNSLQGTVDPVAILTFDQVYRKSDSASGTYLGTGIGIYSGPLGEQTGNTLFGPTYKSTTDIGIKLFLGADLSAGLGLEGTVHFTQRVTLAVVQVRLKL
jgi:hypothetical protein